MKISAKSRYALAALIYMARNCKANETITVLSLSEKLGISKIYLEQVFSLLRRGNVVTSTKGAQGGYRLSRSPGEITARDVFAAIETSLFEKTEPTVPKTNDGIELAMNEAVFDVLDVALSDVLSAISLEEIVAKMPKDEYMYYL